MITISSTRRRARLTITFAAIACTAAVAIHAQAQDVKACDAAGVGAATLTADGVKPAAATDTGHSTNALSGAFGMLEPASRTWSGRRISRSAPNT
jgi:hypothetical protein